MLGVWSEGNVSCTGPFAGSPAKGPVQPIKNLDGSHALAPLPALLAFALCLITLAVNLQAPLYITYADLSGQAPLPPQWPFPVMCWACCRCCWPWVDWLTGSADGH